MAAHTDAARPGFCMHIDYRNALGTRVLDAFQADIPEFGTTCATAKACEYITQMGSIDEAVAHVDTQ